MISIIVPVYNVEKYIDDCVESLVTQTYTNLEIILVDDGSTDTSSQKCDEWARKDSRVKVIHQKNSGGARGGVITGVKAATGDYIAFLDSDDWYSQDAMEKLAEKVNIYKDADCLQFEHYNVYGSSIQKATNKRLEILDGDTLRNQVLTHFFLTGKSANPQWSYGRWDKIYKTDFLKDLICELNPAITIYEDYDMNLHIANRCSKTVLLERCHIYYWRHIGGSISKRMVDKTIDEHILFLNEMENFAKSNQYPVSGICKFRNSVYVDLMIMALFNTLPLSKKKSYLVRLKKLISDPKDILKFADNHAFITRNALKYIARFDCFVPSVLSQLYLKLKK